MCPNGLGVLVPLGTMARKRIKEMDLLTLGGVVIPYFLFGDFFRENS